MEAEILASSRERQGGSTSLAGGTASATYSAANDGNIGVVGSSRSVRRIRGTMSWQVSDRIFMLWILFL